MKKLVAGVHQFQRTIFASQRELFEHLSKGQRPDTLFITCSDSRVVPNLITQTDPGDLFVLRNAGNIVPPWGAVQGGEAATIEYAVSVLGIETIVVTGHSECGAMKALFDPPPASDLPAVRSWLAHAESTRRVVVEAYPDLSPEHRLNVAIQENVLCQLENLRTHPAVASALMRGKLRLHGWVYKIASGEIYAYDVEREQFSPISEQVRPAPAKPMSSRRLAVTSGL
jgi:carbonic anhydrase